MSGYRDSLPASQRPAFSEAISAAARVLARACRDQDQLAAAHGTRAVAEAACYPGHSLGSIEAIETRYIELRDQAGHAETA